MKKTLCALLALWLCLFTCSAGFGEAATVTPEYSIADKLLKQIEAGSGFSGTLTVSLSAAEGHEGAAITTVKPLLFDLDYIRVREDIAAGIPAEERYTITLKEEEEARASASISAKGGSTLLKSELLNEGWYRLPKAFPPAQMPGQEGAGQPAPEDSAAAILTDPAQELLSRSALPSLFSFLIPTLLESSANGSVDISEELGTYLTKMDLWIETFRQNAVLGKLEDGTATMEVHYEVPPAGIKAQSKQLLLDMLTDAPLLSKLQALLPDEYAELLLDPRMQSQYFFAIDELPLEGALVIDRTVSLKGETLALHLSLPLYDSQGGKVTLAYDRKAGTGQDMPDENVISLESRDVSLRLEYQEYKTLTGTTVYQGTLLRQPHRLTAYEVSEADNGPSEKTLSASFTLILQEAVGVDAENFEVLTRDYQITLEPALFHIGAEGVTAPLTEEEKASFYTFPALDLVFHMGYKSKPEKNAPTTLELSAKVGGEGLAQMVELAFTGKTRAKWTPEAIDESQVTDLGTMVPEALQVLLAQAGAKAGLTLLPFIRLVAAPTATPEATLTPAPTATAMPTSTATPEATATPMSTVAATPMPTATPEVTATPAPTVAATPTPTATPEASSVPAGTDAPAAGE